ncbi:MAG: FKBP-type peptidyl-prolyl cis-trans isomerase [Lentimicrobiaceae bacterium]|nr:FKBP-type peptidyl-prolyl cis-trans isomerase [Lentimicrobiaceae bacterium]
MKTQISTLLLVFAFIVTGFNVQAQKSKKQKNDQAKPCEQTQALILKTKQDTISYLIGRDIGSNMRTNEIAVTPEVMLAGLKDGLNSIDSVFSPEVTEQIMVQFQQEMMQRNQQKTAAASAEVKAEGLAFLAENKLKEGVIELPSGLQYKVIKEGEGENPTAEDVVEVHYTGKLLDGTVFDSSVERGETIKFPLNGVIPGWTEGVQLMKPGAKYEFYIPSQLAYGDKGAGPIPGGATLIFEVELISIEKK